MRYAKIREMDISNGEGIGVSLFVQGCHFHCNGCFNPETWDFNGGNAWNNGIKEEFLALAEKSYITRVSILGGEPLCDENVDSVLELIKAIKEMYPQKNIWLYTGYNFDDIMKQGRNQTFSGNAPNKRLECVLNVDVVVDGQFQLDKQDLYNEKIVFAGSTNQRIIHVKNLGTQNQQEISAIQIRTKGD